MLVGIHQPAYLPWLGLIEKIALCDCFIVLDTVQYNARSFQHRTLYSTNSGTAYLSLSVNSKGHQVFGTKIGEVTLADKRIPKTHLATLQHRYGKRPGWSLLSPELEAILSQDWHRLLDLDMALMELTLRHFGIRTKLLLASAVEAEGSKGDLMLSLVRSVGGTSYLSGSGSRAYIVPEKFADAGIDLYWQSFHHPTYPQSHRSDFQPGCFALEWIIEEPDTAAAKFRELIEAARHRI
ncbi:MAG: WbqC family protein [Burkholderiales bacterium]|nr:hypothetical protein [Rhodocyclaceae bacterium]MCZ2175335.1 WbqC family protein [Burkholderiales bacterium]MCZ2420971.1 WbqC family protein [Burkholderiales bacterium]